ncbi:DUF1707 and DUF4870 domain-containing protein [Actinoallomurus purpureus]|uniref:DUF1707 and DUF4870 domain-containing protein n=1 Tax=Actinoallomurus purpureus TaxID=478114 RepID=UPI002093186A|nr:DUF1707 and DUF4870 domain-containing protein [Actinoallomurus purpureus]MCO6008900.1 DUF1707 and DUF4870 domain-containing protein [Actinoallomurus purpureus]
MTTSVPLGALRVSHTEREPIVDRLQQAFAEGRIDKEELDLRLHLAMTAKTRADLDAVLADLAPVPAAAHPAPVPTGEPTAEQRVLAALAHVLGATTLFLGPLIMLCTGARRSPYVRGHIVTALNFQLTLLILTIVTLGVGAIVYAVSWMVCAVAALLALAGTPFRYPFTLRLVR